MKTFKGYKKLTMGNAIQLQILFVVIF